ncbi:YkvI family membrane protein [Paenibacillus agricola]|uniref:Membrane protein YkvI n=1 Tax=Paenibacillus agricola TaxID=2716264 RepID=A0ABX0J7P0_9BACL|nr:hypothetical protein [Paenibacillus agricola]NHN31204.1 hypothetical protein [Paenibacillus agricola]
MKAWGRIIQVGFTYAGTVVGAGFATGQEILQFFTRYGSAATLSISIAGVLFIWMGIKLMLLAHDLKARSYEDMNALLFGRRTGRWINLFTLVTMLGVTTVMLAGAGSVFEEQFHLPYQWGLLFTLVLAYAVLYKGMKAILIVNSIVVPLMLCFIGMVVWNTWSLPSSGNWLTFSTDYSLLQIWLSPMLYAAFNLSMAQGVLVPLGGQTEDRSVLYWGGILGGLIIGIMLLAGHYALSARMPGIIQYDIPMGQLISNLGWIWQLIFIGVIYSEIFTTFIADMFGLTTQLEQHIQLSHTSIVLVLLLFTYIISQFGFKSLLTTLYPLFGLFSLAWLVILIGHRKHRFHTN